MVNETSIFEQAQAIFLSNETVITRLNRLADLMSVDKSMKVSFCEIFGKRWSFVAGSRETPSFDQKITLSDHYGILVEGDLLSDEWIDFLKREFKHLKVYS